MAVREIAKLGEPVLEQKAKPVAKVTKELKALIQDMIETMRDASGLGLAAPQVRVPQRLFVYDVGEGAQALINPEIVEAEGEELGVEGCLSIPKLQGEVLRSARVVVAGLDRVGKSVKIDASGLLARVFQHEIDHLDGILFIKKSNPSTWHWLTEEDVEEHQRRGRRLRVRV
jgi:peptide deformylase